MTNTIKMYNILLQITLIQHLRYNRINCGYYVETNTDCMFVTTAALLTPLRFLSVNKCRKEEKKLKILPGVDLPLFADFKRG